MFALLFPYIIISLFNPIIGPYASWVSKTINLDT